jgi:geranylgeranyl reductase family protein
MLYDVAVIGAGPAGSTTALKLGEKGWNVALFEKDEFAGKTNVCAGGLDYETFSNLAIPGKVMEKRLKGILFRGEKGLLGKAKDELLTVQRRIFDRALAEKASKSCDYFPSTQVNDVMRQGNNWAIETANKKFNSKIVIFADGPLSKIRKKLGVGFEPKRGNCYLSVIREFHSNETSDYLEMVFDEKVSPAGYGWLFPKKDHVNFGMGAFNNTDCKPKQSMNYLIEKYYPEFVGKKPFLERAALIPASLGKKLSSETGLLTVGDAGGFVEPLTGGGISAGIRSGILAAETATKALDNNNIALVKNFESTIRKQGMFMLFNAQSAFLQPLTNVPFLYRKFFTDFFATGTYGTAVGLASKIINPHKKELGKGISW